MKINKWLACFLLIVALTGLFPENALALEQILNGTFNTDAANWTSNSPVSQAYIINNFDQNAGYFQMQYTTANGAAGLYWYADGELYQTFPSAALPADVNARINSSYNGLKGGNAARGYSLSAVGTIRRDDAPATVVDTFLNYSNTGVANFDSGWLNTTEKTTLLPGGYQYRMYLYASLGAEKQADPEMRFDNLSCNISPSGLVASETTSGECYLNWNDSTMGSPAVDYYKIYRRTSESDPWVAYDTSASSDYTDLTPAATEAVYYAVTDVDLNGTESPLSPQAIFRRAKISITKVESTPAQVTIGQTGIGVKVYITNTGYSPASVDEVSLYFSDPAVGLYNVIQNTGLPIELASGASTIVEFSVDVLDGSNPDTDYIDAIATGTNLQTSQIITDTEADVNHSWLIRSPANLVVQTITTPSIVYRDQRDVPISITVLNDGDKNAAAYYESTEFLFSTGTYNNIRVVDPMPVTVYSGLTATVNYLVDVDINCATGTCIIDANIDFRDVNLLISSTNFDGAAAPGEWTVVAGVIKTYKGPPLYPSYTIEANSFNQGDNIVYASAANLIPLAEYRFRWFDPSSAQVQVTDPPLTTDSNGVINDEFILTGASPLGTWRITVTNVNTTTPLAETNFEVVTPAAISATLDLPNFVTLDQNFVATLTVSNTGGADVSDVTPYDLLKLVSNVGDATYISGPTPANSLIEGLSQKEFSFVYQANTVGDFQLEGSASGFDANDSSPLLTATATSNICVIQTKPVLTVNSVTETYDFVSRNQTGLIVTMEIENAGEAGVYVDAASLSFNIGSYTQTVTSPSPLPFLLAGNSTANVTFKVDVAPDSSTGVDTISGSFSCYEANDPSSTYGVSGGTTGSWEIMSASGKCSANSGFNPEQYEFEANMVVYVEFVGVLANDSHKFFVYDDEAAGTLISESGVLTANATGILGYQFTLPAAPTISKWRIEVWEVKSPGGNLEQRLGFQFFNVVNQGNLVTSLSIEPDVVELGDNVTVKMSVSNTVADSSTLYPTVPSAPALTAGSIGTLSLVSGPTPASASIAYGSPATFTWTYLTTSNTGVGSLTLTADATGEDLVTTNSDNPVSVTSNTALSNRLLILSRDLELASASLILGDVECGQTAVVYPDLDNTGNTSLVSVNWQKALPTDNGFNIPYGYFSFSPPSGFSVATSASELSSFTLTMPYNQPAGTYIANMSVFDDINGNSARDLGEPFDEFGVEVTAPDCRVVVAADELIDLGGWPADTSAATQTFNAFNGGNLELEDLKFTQLTATFTLSEIFITPMVYGSLATDAVLIASVSAYVGNDPQGTYIATWRVWNDGPGSASDTFQVKFSIGNKSFSFTPEPFDLGNATPTYTLSNFNFDITNTGNLDITNLAVTPFDLVNGANTIPADNIFFEIPTTLAPAETKTATVTVYIPGGTAIGDYSGGQFFFDDQDDDGLYSGGANEAFNNLTLQLHVNEYWALQVIPSTVDLGGIAPGEPAKNVGFLCKNSGNATLTALTWEPTNLIYNAFTIPTTDYSFTPAPLFSAGPGVVFPATISIAVDITQDPGFYSGSFGWLFEDKLLDARDVDDPQDSFKITCQVGSKEIQVTTAGPLSVNGTPNALSTEANFSIKNTGTLILTKPKAKLITDLDDGVNTPIPAANGVCTPAVFDYMNPDQSKSGTWAVNIPAAQPVGIYTGVLKVWDDTNNDGVPDVTEASDTVNVELEVFGKRVLAVSPNPLDFFFVPAGESATGEFIVTNTGNVDIIGPAELVQVSKANLDPTFAGPPSISSANLTFNPVLTISNNLPIGASTIATVTVSVPAGQTSGGYSGVQKIYVDYNTQNNSFDSAVEEFADLTLQLTVGQKDVDILSATVNVGSGNPEQTLSNVFTVKNMTSIPLSKLKWVKRNLLSGANTIPGTSITYSSPGPFGLSSNGSKNITTFVTIPAYQAPGVYTASQTVYEDEDGSNTCNGFEASATYDLTVTVNTYENLVLSTDTTDLGNMNTGETSAPVTFYYQNRGNVTLNSISPITANLTGPSSTINSALVSLTLASTTPISMLPGDIGEAELTLGPIPADQAAETYSGFQTICDTVQTNATDSLNLIVNIQSSIQGPDLASGAMFQEIATTTFSDTTDERFILSAWVCPGTSTARLAFVESQTDGTVVNIWSLSVDQAGQLTPAGATIDSGIIQRNHWNYPLHGRLPWYHVYIAFDYHFDEAVSDQTFIVLQNMNADAAAKYSVWFDGVQLEKAITSDQKRPTTFSDSPKLLSPTRKKELLGENSYQEW